MSTAPITAAAADADAALAKLSGIVGQLSDADLARAHFGGGWSVAQVISHINVSALLWVAAVTRVAADPDISFFFREEVGHDALGYPPPTVDIATRQIASTRQTIASTFPTISADVAARSIEIPDLGTMTVEAWTPLIVGHLVSHVDQALDIMRNRNVAPAGV
jgi:hypothetical protein